MRDQTEELILKAKDPVAFESDFFQTYLRGKTFRGFWYDHNEESYGIVLEFRRNLRGKIGLFAQDTLSGNSLHEYRIDSDSFVLEQIAYDKVLISISSLHSSIISSTDPDVNLPSCIEFTLHLLSQHSIYIQFINHKQFSPPINKLRFGLVLAVESSATT